MSVASHDFRDTLRHFPSGVTIVTVRSGARVHGLTVSAFASVSPSPPLVSIIIDHEHTAYSLLESEDATFAVSILHQDQIELGNRFAWVKDEDRFEEGKWIEALTGAPVLADALAWMDCTIYARCPAGTHTIYVGEVQACGSPRSGEPPLVYWDRGYRKLHVSDHDPGKSAS